MHFFSREVNQRQSDIPSINSINSYLKALVLSNKTPAIIVPIKPDKTRIKPAYPNFCVSFFIKQIFYPIKIKYGHI